MNLKFKIILIFGKEIIRMVGVFLAMSVTVKETKQMSNKALLYSSAKYSCCFGTTLNGV